MARKKGSRDKKKRKLRDKFNEIYRNPITRRVIAYGLPIALVGGGTLLYKNSKAFKKFIDNATTPPVRKSRFDYEEKTRSVVQQRNKNGEWVDYQKIDTTDKPYSREVYRDPVKKSPTDRIAGLARNLNSILITANRLRRMFNRSPDTALFIKEIEEKSSNFMQEEGVINPSLSRNYGLYKAYANRIKKAKNRYRWNLAKATLPDLAGTTAGSFVGGGLSSYIAGKALSDFTPKRWQGKVIKGVARLAGAPIGAIVGRGLAAPYTQRNVKKAIIPDKKTLSYLLPTPKIRRKIMEDPELINVIGAASDLKPNLRGLRNIFPNRNKLQNFKNTAGLNAVTQTAQKINNRKK